MSAFGAVASALVVTSNRQESDERRAADDAQRRAEAVLAWDPREGAILSLAAYRLQPSARAELAMLRVAQRHEGVRRVMQAHDGEVTAATSVGDLTVSAGGDGTLRTWRSDTGEQVGVARVDVPIVQLRATARLPSAALALDREGTVWVWDLNDAAAPVPARFGDGGHPVFITPSSLGGKVLVVTADGLVRRWDLASGARLRSLDLASVKGRLPWRGRRPRVVAAALDADGHLPDASLVVAMASGAVARINLRTMTGRTVMPGEQVTGDVTGLALSEYEDFSLAVVGTGGVSLWNDAKNRVVSDRSLPAAGVAYVDGSFVVGTAEGVQRYDATSGAPVGAAAGGEATVIASAGSGAIATHPDGALSIIGTSSVGLALPPAEADNAVARFGPDGTLLTVEGDPNYVTELIAVRPPTEARSDGVSVAYRPARRFEPAADWWPQEDDDFQRWYVNDAVLGHELAVAGGQDPTGSASVLVWNARTGRPIRRLPLTTGATETSTPSIVSRVALLPERELLAAYSTVQESIVLWSTATWQQIATIDVGPAGGFSVSPDESRIAVIGLSDEQSGEDAGVARARLQLIDVEDRRATVARTLKDATDVAFSPDGHRLALVDAGRLRMLAPDGREDTEPPIPIETESVSDIAWRPDSKLVAISQWHGGTILVDPASRVVSPALVAPGESSPRTLSWSPSGGLLAVTNSVDSDDHEIPVKATVWRLSPKSLEQRMCALAGGDPGGRWWRREIRADVPRRPLCLPPTAPRPEGKRLPRRPVLAYVAGNQVGVAATTGDPVIVDEIGDDEMGQVTFTWSPTGAMAWATGGRVSALRDGRLDRWNCACTAAEFDGEVLVAADAEGTALLRFGPDRGVVRRTPVRGLPYLRPEVRAAARGRAIVDGTTGDHPRLVITQRAMARPLRLPSSRRVTAAAVDPIGARALVRITAPTDECFDSDALATVQLVGGRVVPVAVSADIPRPFTVRSIAWSEAGAHAVLARADCSQQRAPTGQRMRLEPSRLIRVPGRAYDVQSARGVTATLDGVDSVATKGGTLALRYRRQSHVVAKDVLSMALRP